MWKFRWFENVYKVVLLMLGVWVLSPGMVTPSTMPRVRFNWTKTNDRFRENVGANLSIATGSNLIISCPNNTNPLEYYSIYWVSEQGFKECFKPANDSKLAAKCNKPNITWELTLEIKVFTGVPYGTDFIIGKNYYLATFSTGTANGMNNEIGGACRDHNMKLNLTIIPQVPPTTPGPTNHTSSTSPISVTPSSKATTKTTKPPTSPTPTTPRETTHPTPKLTTRIPAYTDIPVISVPDPGSGGNTAIIDISSSAQTCQSSWFLVLSLCLSLVHILYYNREYIHR